MAADLDADLSFIEDKIKSLKNSENDSVSKGMSKSGSNKMTKSILKHSDDYIKKSNNGSNNSNKDLMKQSKEESKEDYYKENFDEIEYNNPFKD